MKERSHFGSFITLLPEENIWSQQYIKTENGLVSQLTNIKLQSEVLSKMLFTINNDIKFKKGECYHHSVLADLQIILEELQKKTEISTSSLNTLLLRTT